MKKTEIEKILEVEKEKARDNESLSKMMADFGPFLAVANIPLALVVSSLGMIASAVEDNKSMNTHPMPDEWLKNVSEMQTISESGLSFLSKCIEKKGFVSVNEAIKFMKNETKEEQKKNNKQNEINIKEQIVNNHLSEGAMSLLKRAKENSIEETMSEIVQKSLKETVALSKKINFLKKER